VVPLPALLWWGISGRQAVPPNDDGSHHGLIVACILARGRRDRGHVLAADVALLFAMKVVSALSGDAGYRSTPAADPAYDAEVRRIVTRLPVDSAYLGTRLFPDHCEPTAPTLSAGRGIAGGGRIAFRTPALSP